MGLRIAMYTHSLNPRGGVVHALSLAEALQTSGHQVTLIAPQPAGATLFRQTTVPTRFFPAEAVTGDLAALVQRRVGEYVAAVRSNPDPFDLHHAHDGMSGVALAGLRERGEIPAYVRTVHHLEDFGDAYLRVAQNRSVEMADLVLCVSRVWAEQLQTQFGREAIVVPNGVDLKHFTPVPQPDDQARCEAIAGPLPGPVLLAVGGIERRKNTLRILQAFLLARPNLPAGTRLVIVGGASLRDHSDYRSAFDDTLAGSPHQADVRVLGSVPDDLMPALYRRATALVFPSLVEGFGLAVLEAMASGRPVITSSRPPFTEYITENDGLLVDPVKTEEIAAAMVRLMDPSICAAYASRGHAVAERFSWPTSAHQHIAAYGQLPAPTGDRHARDALCRPVAG